MGQNFHYQNFPFATECQWQADNNISAELTKKSSLAAAWIQNECPSLEEEELTKAKAMFCGSLKDCEIATASYYHRPPNQSHTKKSFIQDALMVKCHRGHVHALWVPERLWNSAAWFPKCIQKIYHLDVIHTAQIGFCIFKLFCSS